MWFHNGEVAATAPGIRTETLPMFPLSSVLFPYGLLPLHVFETRYRALVADRLANEEEFGVVLISRGHEVGGGDERVDTGALAKIEAASEFSDGRLAVIARGTGRLAVHEWLEDDPYPRAIVERLPDEAPTRPELVAAAEASVRRARTLISELRTGASAIEPGLDLGEELREIAWRLCSLAPLTPLDHLLLLSIDDPDERVACLAGLTDDVAEDARRLLVGS
jgi:hypothetical protein